MRVVLAPTMAKVAETATRTRPHFFCVNFFRDYHGVCVDLPSLTNILLLAVWLCCSSLNHFPILLLRYSLKQSLTSFQPIPKS